MGSSTAELFLHPCNLSTNSSCTPLEVQNKFEVLNEEEEEKHEVVVEHGGFLVGYRGLDRWSE